MPGFLQESGIENSVWSEAADASATAAASSEEEDEYASIQMEREKEFMAVLMGSLDGLPDDIVDSVYDELFQQLRTKLNDALLQAPEVGSPDGFDEVIVAVLSSDEFVNEMVSVRDGILDYIQTHLEAEHGEGVEEEGVAEIINEITSTARYYQY